MISLPMTESLLQNEFYVQYLIELERTKQEQERTKQIQEQERTKQIQEQERTKQIQLKALKKDDTISVSPTEFYQKLTVTKVKTPHWLTQYSQTTTFRSPQTTFLNENALQDTLMPLINQIFSGSNFSAYDFRNHITLSDTKPDVLIIPSLFFLKPFIKPKNGKEDFDSLCSNGGLTHLIQSVIEIKHEVNLATSNASKGQMFSYLYRILLNHPTKKKVVGALTNGTKIMFFRITRYDQFEYFETDELDFIDFNKTVHSSEGLQYLLGMIKDGISSDIPLPSSELVLRSYVGKGATSVVYRTSVDEVVKLCTSESYTCNFKIEYSRLTHLHKELPENLKCHIPKVEDEGNNFVKFKFYKKADISKVNLGMFYDLVTLLRKVHDLEYCHRDIRPDNLLLTDDGKLVLIDWGFSSKISDEPVIFYGTASFCAGEFGQKQMQDIMCPYKPEYDIESLFKTILYFHNESIRDELKLIRGLPLMNRIKEANKIWNNYESLFPTRFTFTKVNKKIEEMIDNDNDNYMNDEIM